MPNPRRIYLGEEYRPIPLPTVHAHKDVAVEYVRRREVIRLVADPAATEAYYQEYTLGEFFAVLGITRAAIRRAFGELPPLDAEVIDFVQAPVTPEQAERLAEISEVSDEAVE